MKNKLFIALILMIFGWQLNVNAQPYDIVWTDDVGVTVASNTITKTAGTAWGNAGAASTNVLPAGENGWIEMTVLETNTFRMFGFSSVNIDPNYTTIEYAINPRQNLPLGVYESGVSRGLYTAYNVGDILRVERIGTTIYYKQNGLVIYTSTVPSTTDLIADCALYNLNSTIGSAQASFDVGGGGGGGGGGSTVWNQNPNSDIYYSLGSVAIGATDPLGQLYVKNEDVAASALVIDQPASTGATYGLQIKVPNATTKAFSIEENGTSQLQINGDGKMYAREVEVTLSSFPDYVFGDKYELYPLSKLQQFIDKNHHLPNIPPAAEIDENGIGLGELGILQMEKIEELTLYLLQINERLEKVEAENKALKEELERLKK